MLELNGKVRYVGQPKQGVSQTTGKAWEFAEVQFEYGWRTSQDGTQYSDSIVLSAWNDALKQIQSFPPGVMLHVLFSTTTRDYNGKPYNDLRVFKVEPVTLTQHPQMQQQMYAPQQMQMPIMQQPMYAPQMSAPFQGQQPQGGFVAPQGTVHPTAPQQGMAQAGGGAPAGDMPF